MLDYHVRRLVGQEIPGRLHRVHQVREFLARSMLAEVLRVRQVVCKERGIAVCGACRRRENVCSVAAYADVALAALETGLFAPP